MQHFLSKVGWYGAGPYKDKRTIIRNTEITGRMGDEEFLVKRALAHYKCTALLKEDWMAEEFPDSFRSPEECSYVASWREEEAVHYFDPRSPERWKEVPEGKTVYLYDKELQPPRPRNNRALPEAEAVGCR